MAVTVDDGTRVRIVATQAAVARRAAAAAIAVRDDDFSARKIDFGDRRQIVEDATLGGAPLPRRVIIAAHGDDFLLARRERAKHRRAADVSGVDCNIARTHDANDAGVQESVRIRKNGDPNGGHRKI
jgi:hypothetical protein